MRVPAGAALLHRVSAASAVRGVFAAQLALQRPQLAVNQRAHGRCLALWQRLDRDVGGVNLLLQSFTRVSHQSRPAPRPRHRRRALGAGLEQRTKRPPERRGRA